MTAITVTTTPVRIDVVAQNDLPGTSAGTYQSIDLRVIGTETVWLATSEDEAEAGEGLPVHTDEGWQERLSPTQELWAYTESGTSEVRYLERGV